MKNNFFVLLILTLGFGMFWSCSSEDDIITTDEEFNGELRSTTLIEQPSQNINELNVVKYPNGLSNSDAYYPPGGGSIGYSILRSSQLSVSTWTNTGYKMNSYTIIKFDLSRLKSTDAIKKATLKLCSHPAPVEVSHYGRANNGDNNAFYVRQISSSWEAGSINYQNLPSVTTARQVTVPHTSYATLDISIDVTNIVRDMVSTNKNYGFYLQLVNESAYNSRLFCNSIYPVESKRPALEVVFN